MPAIKHSNGGAAAAGGPVLNFLNALGQLVNAISLYGGQHKITRQYLSQASASLAAALKSRKPIRFTFQDGQFFADNQPVENETSFVGLVRRKLQKLEVTGFSLAPGIDEDELFKLARSLAFGNGPGATIFGDKAGHIQAESSRYARIQESEVVVNKKAVSGGALKRAADGAFELTIDDSHEPPASAPGVQQIMAFLKGDGGTPSGETAQALQNAASDINQLGRMIMEAAAVRQRDPLAAQGESLADIVVGCLRRTFDGLNKQPAQSRNPAAIKQTMMLLEKDILDRLRQNSAAGRGAEQAVADAVGSMLDDLTIEAVSQTYVQRRNAVEADGARLAACLRSLSPEKLAGLKSSLMANGMTPEGWQELVVRSGAGPGGQGASEASAGLAALGALLEKLDRLMSSGKTQTPEAQQAITQVQQGVQRAAEQAAGKIHDLENTVVKTAGGLDAPETNWRRLSAEQQVHTMELIAEIVQELAQPLSAMNCAVGMTLQERIGPLADAQKNILALAADSGEKIADLFERLRKVTGLPHSLIPDKESVYGISLG